MICEKCKSEIKEEEEEWIVIPEGCDMLTIQQGFSIFDNKELVKKVIPEEYGKTHIPIACKQLNIDRKKARSRWLGMYRDLVLFSVWSSLAYSDSLGRVVFCRALKEPFLEKRSRKKRGRKC